MRETLRIQIFADGADAEAMRVLAMDAGVAGFTTNPSLMRRAGVVDYERFAREVLEAIPDKPISFEVIADDAVEIERQARRLASWGRNVFVKIPVTTTDGTFNGPVIRRLLDRGTQLNLTAVLTRSQLFALRPLVDADTVAVVSVFAGRVADTGDDPVPLMREAVGLFADLPRVQTLWASCREVWNIVQADRVGCDIITVPTPILTKLPLLGKDATAHSLDTVRQFFRDACESGLEL